MSEHTPTEAFETSDNEEQPPTLNIDALNSIVRALNNDPSVLDEAKNELSDNSTGIDRFFASQQEFIKLVAEGKVVPDETIETQLEELSIALGAMRGLSKSNDQIIEYIESLEDRSRILARTVGHLLRRIDSQEDAATNNLKKISELQDVAEILKERILLDSKFPNMYNPKGTRIKIIELMQSTERSRTGITLRYIDYRGFTEINKMLGHPTADKILHSVCEQLRKGDIFGRHGGDEFISTNITPRQEESSSPLTDSLGYANSFLNAQYEAIKQFKNEISPKKYARLQKIMGAKIGCVQITGNEIADCRSDKTKLEDLYDSKLDQADKFSTSIAQDIRSAIIDIDSDEEPELSNQATTDSQPQTINSDEEPELSQIAVVYNQPRAIKGKNGDTITKPYTVCTIIEADTVPNVDTQPFKPLVTILNPARVLGYDEEHFVAEFKARSEFAAKLLTPDLARDVNLSDIKHDIDLRDDKQGK